LESIKKINLNINFDRWTWDREQDCVFSFSFAYAYLQQSNYDLNCEGFQKFWFIKALPNTQFLSWRVIMGEWQPEEEVLTKI